MVKFDNKLEGEYYADRMFKGEIARYSMIALCEYFVMNKNMNEKDFFRIQKEALAKFKEDSSKL